MKQATLQELYNLISEGKGDKTSFHRQALRQFPNLFTAQSSFDQVVTVLMQKQIIAESSVQPVEKTNWFDVFKNNMDIIAEETKAEEKKTSKEVEEDQSKVYKNKDKKSIDNVNGAEFLEGFYLESREEKNANKTVEQIRDIVVKNLAKDPLYYIKDGAFGVKGLGYKEEAPGLGKTKEVTGKYKSSGMEPVKLSESKHSSEADLKIYKSELNMLNKIKPTGEKQLKRKAFLEKKIADLEKKMTEVFYGSSDGDYDADQEDEQMAYYNYDKGLEAYGEGDYLKAERYYKTALKYGSYLGWTEQDLPPYGDDMSESLSEAKEEFWAVERPNGEIIKYFSSQKEAQAWIRKNDPEGMVDYNVIQIEESLSEVDAFDMPTGAMMIQMADNNPSQFKKYVKQMNSDPGFKVQFMKKLSDDEKEEFKKKLEALKEGLPKGYWAKNIPGGKDEMNEDYKALVKKIKGQGKSEKAAKAIAGAVASAKLKGAGKGPTSKQKARSK